MRSAGKDFIPASNIMNSNEYMLQLHKRLVEKTYGTPPRNVSENTATAYIKTLYNLNDKKPFTNLAFLKKKDDIMKKLEGYAESTQKTLISTIASVLSLEKDKAGYKGIYKFYYDKMMEKAKEASGADTATKTTKQEENWVDWDDVKKKYAEMGIQTLKDKKPSWEHLLPLMVLGLYVETPPRRNQDYLKMDVVRTTKKSKVSDLPTDKNYLVLGGRGVPLSFVFNVYKTSKTYGQQTVPIPDSLKTVVKAYIKHHPEKTQKQFAFLVDSGNVPLTADNAITRILNKIFGKNVGSSMLRHIYLSNKYDISEMKDDAEDMGHSLTQQKQYLKEDRQTSFLPLKEDTPPATP